MKILRYIILCFCLIGCVMSGIGCLISVFFEKIADIFKKIFTPCEGDIK
jgi:hypothetical protein